MDFALRNGYRHIDTAANYQNETEGIKASGVPRKQIFLTTKFNNPDRRNPPAALESSLKKLYHPYVDLCTDSPLAFKRKTLIPRAGLMHYPAPMAGDEKADKERDRLDTWKAMEELYFANLDELKAISKTRASLRAHTTHVFLDVSDFSVVYLERLLPVARVVPAVNEIELCP